MEPKTTEFTFALYGEDLIYYILQKNNKNEHDSLIQSIVSRPKSTVTFTTRRKDGRRSSD